MDYRISAITLDRASMVRGTPAIEQEREVAIADLLEANSFRPVGSRGGPYRLALGVEENRLVFDVRLEGAPADAPPHGRILLSLTPFRKLIRDYFLVCDSYYKAVRNAPPSQMESLDMGRRALHDEGTRLLQQRLKGKIETDFATARRLFTLITVLHLKGHMTGAGAGAAARPLPASVLFACTMNAVRSPMAAAMLRHLYGARVHVESAGVRAGILDPLAVEVMAEIGIELSSHQPRDVEDVEPGAFGLVVTLSPEAQHKAVELTRTAATSVEYWQILDPTVVEGSREQRLAAYRGVRDMLGEKLKARFG